LGFFPKIIVIQSFIINWNNNLIIISLIFRTLIALVFYLKIIISVILKNRLVYLKQNILNKTNIKLIIINALGIFIFLLFFIN
jgi:NADH:ubiquinone oxidoreductase subunit 2 (subunit N)